MAFEIKTQGQYGAGSDGSLKPSAAAIVNAYAQVVGLNANILTLGNISDESAFKVGAFLLIHVSLYTGSQSSWNYLGRWIYSQITAISGTSVTVKKTVEGLVKAEDLSNCIIQAVVVPQYSIVTLNSSASLTCPQFNRSLGYGGIIAFKCSDELKFNGGHINLSGKGLESAADRKPLAFEQNTSYRGFENGAAYKNLPLNYPDGALWLVTKKLTCHASSRIGNPSQSGIARTLPAKEGGASLMIAAESVASFDSKIISTTAQVDGKGQGRCYLATETRLPNDEGLYAYDRISDTSRLSRVFNIQSFGDAGEGSKTDYTSKLNNYAQVTAIDSTRKKFTVAHMTTDGLAKFKVGALVMIHATHKKIVNCSGRFILATVLDHTLNVITTDTAFPNESGLTAANYAIQLVTVPQFENFTLAKTNSATGNFEEGRGGICALACSDTCDLRGGKLLVEGKGSPALANGQVQETNPSPAYAAAGLDYISNAQLAEKLPLGSGHGSVFILAKNLVMDSATRIGASYSGMNFGGLYGAGSSSSTSTLGYGNPDVYPQAGSGKQGGVRKGTGYDLTGGFGSNGKCEGSTFSALPGGRQGAHILLVADKISGLSLAALSTGGGGGEAASYSSNSTLLKGGNGGCGFGGGGARIKVASTSADPYGGGSGGFHGGGAGCHVSAAGDNASAGGAGGFCFVYCNSFDSQNTKYLST